VDRVSIAPATSSPFDKGKQECLKISSVSQTNASCCFPAWLRIQSNAAITLLCETVPCPTFHLDSPPEFRVLSFFLRLAFRNLLRHEAFAWRAEVARRAASAVASLRGAAATGV